MAAVPGPEGNTGIFRTDGKRPRSGISRILFSTIIPLGPKLPVGSGTLPANLIESISSVCLCELAPRRVYLVSLRTDLSAIHTFCCTCPRLTTDGRYPLRYSMVSGLSSRGFPPATVSCSRRCEYREWRIGCQFYYAELRL